MIAVDTNILVYAHRQDLPLQSAAQRCMAALAEGDRAWGIPLPCIHEFLAVVTNERAFKPASTIDQAFDQVSAWLDSPRCRLLHTTDEHLPVLEAITKKAKTRGGQFHDARVAAICIENGITELWTVDRDFSRFKGLKTTNPLV